MIVLDASAAIELLLASPKGAAIARRIAPVEQTLHAPHLIDLEVAQTLRRCVRRGQVDGERAAEALADLTALDLVRYGHDVLMARIWELRNNVTCYDAAYLALAEVLPAALVTTDWRLRSIPGVSARVEVS